MDVQNENVGETWGEEPTKTDFLECGLAKFYKSRHKLVISINKINVLVSSSQW